MSKSILNRFLLILIIPVSLFYTGCQKNNKTPLIIFHAGSLSVPFEIMEKEFEKRYPFINILREPAGSIKCVRKITDLNKPCDIMASADYTIINKLLIPDYAEWNIRLARNKMVLCFTTKSHLSKKINSLNWYEILQDKNIVWGHANPDLDPCGYRALMVIQLAEKFYQSPGLYKKILTNRSVKNIRPKSVELISLLQTGHMDYAWEYLSTAVQHNLKYIRLPDEINLGNYIHDPFYRQAVVKVSGKTPAEHILIKGQSITYGITLIKNTPHYEEAIKFLTYLLHPEKGLKILAKTGQTPFIPVQVSSQKIKNKLPQELQALVSVKN